MKYQKPESCWRTAKAQSSRRDQTVAFGIHFTETTHIFRRAYWTLFSFDNFSMQSLAFEWKKRSEKLKMEFSRLYLCWMLCLLWTWTHSESVNRNKISVWKVVLCLHLQSAYVFRHRKTVKYCKWEQPKNINLKKIAAKECMKVYKCVLWTFAAFVSLFRIFVNAFRDYFRTVYPIQSDVGLGIIKIYFTQFSILFDNFSLLG